MKPTSTHLLRIDAPMFTIANSNGVEFDNLSMTGNFVGIEILISHNVTVVLSLLVRM